MSQRFDLPVSLFRTPALQAVSKHLPAPFQGIPGKILVFVYVFALFILKYLVIQGFFNNFGLNSSRNLGLEFCGIALVC